MKSEAASPIHRLPAELLRLIFIFAIADPAEVITPSLYRDFGEEVELGCHEISRTKKSLPLVAPSWRGIATEFLYHRIQLVEIIKLVHLVDVLKQSQDSDAHGRSHSWWITHIRINYYLPNSWHDVQERYLSRLIALCSNLSSFVYTPYALMRGGSGVPSSIIRNLAESCFATLRCVAFGGDDSTDFGDVEYLASRCKNLEHLGIAGVATSGSPTSFKLPSNVHAITLCDNAVNMAFDGLHLHHISLINYFDRHRQLERFLELQGPTLTSLQYRPSHGTACNLHSILAECPNITSLAIDFRTVDLSRFTAEPLATVVKRIWIYGLFKLSSPRHHGDGRELTKLKKLSAFTALEWVCLPDLTTSTILDIASTDSVGAELWIQGIADLEARSIAVVDRNGVDVKESLFADVAVKYSDRSSSLTLNYQYESPEHSSGSDDSSDILSSSQDEQVDSDFARSLRRRLVEVS
jgi:hypothetical protein